LIAELGAAFLCNQLELTPQTQNHASYLAHWLNLLKQDNRLFLKASREASKASDYLMDEEDLHGADENNFDAVMSMRGGI
jgi:antirestriction protein ArdC